MILMKFSGVNGDSKIRGYEKWITLTSFEFGVNRSVETLHKGKDIVIKRSEPQEVTIGKTTDCATVDLMYKAIKDRSPQETNAPASAEIHFVQPQTEDFEGARDIKAFLKVKLGTVLISEWSLDGSEDERPTESLTLHFSQVAMEYMTTEDGKVYQRYGPRGWDVAKAPQGDWKPPEWEKKEYSEGKTSTKRTQGN